MSVDFKAILSRKADDVKPPDVFPAGSYRGAIRPGLNFGESSQKKTPFVEYQVSLTEPAEGGGVEAADLVNAEGEAIDITKKVFRVPFYLTDNALNMLKEFIISCGVPVEGRSMDELVSEVIGAEVLIDLIQKPSSKGGGFYNEISQIVGAGQ